MSPAERAGHAIAHQMGGGVHHSSGDWRVRCPVHGGEDANLSIRNGTLAADLVVTCHSHGCDRRDILRAIEAAGGREPCDDKRVERRRLQRVIEPKPQPDPEKLRWLLKQLLPIEGTVVATYLDSRGVDLPPDDNHLRYLPANPPKYVWPSMVGIVTDFTDASRIMSLHFTRLRDDGRGKAPLPKEQQRSYLKGYPKRGGVIRLCDDAEVTLRLGVAEGVETALAVYTSFRRVGWFQPVWSALDAGNIALLPHLRGIDQLFIYADRGPAGGRAADDLARRWLDAGTDVLISPAPVDDWNLAVAP